jgi:hypothetical protein
MRGDHLDVSVDDDVLNTIATKLHFDNELVERGLWTKYPDPSDDDYSKQLYKLAESEMRMSAERARAVEALYPNLS